MNMNNRRNAPRTKYKGMVDLVMGRRLYKEPSDNISSTGIFINSSSPEKYAIFDKLTLTFQLPDASPVKRVGQIVRKNNNGIGVTYLDIEPPREYHVKPNIQTLFSPVI